MTSLSGVMTISGRNHFTFVFLENTSGVKGTWQRGGFSGVFAEIGSA
jgi:hypothetical protein